MRELSQYKVGIYGISNDTHEFDFDDQFFSLFVNPLVGKGKGSCKISMLRSSSIIDLNLHITGSVELVCDRSLESFNYEIDTSQELIYKYGDEEKELSENVFVIPKDTQEINIGYFLYEFISIEIPMKKLHPKFQDENENQGENENDEWIYSSQEEGKEEKGIDPRWDVLKKLK